MAHEGTKVTGRRYLLGIDTAGGTNYGKVVCLKGSTLKVESEEIDASTKCGDDVYPSDKQKASLDITLLLVKDANATTELSADDLYTLVKNKTVNMGISFSPTTPVTGEPTYAGTGWLKGWTMKADDGDLVTIDTTVVFHTLPTQTVTP